MKPESTFATKYPWMYVYFLQCIRICRSRENNTDGPARRAASHPTRFAIKGPITQFGTSIILRRSSSRLREKVPEGSRPRYFIKIREFPENDVSLCAKKTSLIRSCSFFDTISACNRPHTQLINRAGRKYHAVG